MKFATFCTNLQKVITAYEEDKDYTFSEPEVVNFIFDHVNSEPLKTMMDVLKEEWNRDKAFTFNTLTARNQMKIASLPKSSSESFKDKRNINSVSQFEGIDITMREPDEWNKLDKTEKFKIFQARQKAESKSKKAGSKISSTSLKDQIATLAKIVTQLTETSNRGVAKVTFKDPVKEDASDSPDDEAGTSFRGRASKIKAKKS